MPILDTERWAALKNAEAEAREDSSPSMLEVQQAQARWSRCRDDLERARRPGALGNVSRPAARARAGEEVLGGIGGHDQDGIVRVHRARFASLMPTPARPRPWSSG